MLTFVVVSTFFHLSFDVILYKHMIKIILLEHLSCLWCTEFNWIKKKLPAVIRLQETYFGCDQDVVDIKGFILARMLGELLC